VRVVRRGIDWALGDLSRGFGQAVIAIGVALGTGAGIAAALIAPPPVAVSIGLAAVFAVVASVVVGLAANMLIGARDLESRLWGGGALLVALGWLAHPALLLVIPPFTAPFAAVGSMVASAVIARLAAGAAEAMARP
jgi:hypothetical protein